MTTNANTYYYIIAKFGHPKPAEGWERALTVFFEPPLPDPDKPNQRIAAMGAKDMADAMAQLDGLRRETGAVIVPHPQIADIPDGVYRYIADNGAAACAIIFRGALLTLAYDGKPLKQELVRNYEDVVVRYLDRAMRSERDDFQVYPLHHWRHESASLYRGDA